MIHHCVVCKLRAGVSDEIVEHMIRSARSMLLRIPEALAVKSGKRVDSSNEWPFFYAIDVESLAKLAILQDDPIFLKFTEDIIKPYTRDAVTLDYETDPGRDIKYS